MKKYDLHGMIIAGMATGLILSKLNLNAEAKDSSSFMKRIVETKGNIANRAMTQDDLLLELNQEGANLYMSLSPEGQKLALKLASRSCNGLNDCAGQNACASKDNACAGLGKCMGKTICAISDKNLAVKLAAKLMSAKRNQLQQNSSSPPPSKKP